MSKSRQPLKIAVVGHTNAGKTSLVRTLLHSRGFGEVRDRGGTTRQVSSAPLRIGSRSLIEVYDSPGLENAPELIEWLEQLPGERHDGPERIHHLLGDMQARTHFDHEARVLELLLEADVALYVIDARELVLEKYLDELNILTLCAKPIIAVLNFTASTASGEQQWREALARSKLHTVLSFDAVMRDPATEVRLFEKLKSQLDGFSAVLDEWMAYRREEENTRRQAALTVIAELLIDVAAGRREPLLSEASRVSAAFQERVKKREQHCVETLLDLYRFGQEDYRDAGLPLTAGQWQADPFDTETLRHYGISTSKYLGAGASTGAAFDIGTGGLSLGAGTVTGAIVGASAGLVRNLGDRVLPRFRGRSRILVDEATLRLLAWRQLTLLQALIVRGHASQAPLQAAVDERWKEGKLPSALRRARHHTAWSSLNPDYMASAAREASVASLSRSLDGDIHLPSSQPEIKSQQ